MRGLPARHVLQQQHRGLGCAPHVLQRRGRRAPHVAEKVPLRATVTGRSDMVQRSVPSCDTAECHVCDTVQTQRDALATRSQRGQSCATCRRRDGAAARGDRTLAPTHRTLRGGGSVGASLRQRAAGCVGHSTAFVGSMEAAWLVHACAVDRHGMLRMAGTGLAHQGARRVWCRRGSFDCAEVSIALAKGTADWPCCAPAPRRRAWSAP